MFRKASVKKLMITQDKKREQHRCLENLNHSLRTEFTEDDGNLYRHNQSFNKDKAEIVEDSISCDNKGVFELKTRI